MKFVDRNPKGDREDARHEDQETEYRQDQRHNWHARSGSSFVQPPAAAMVTKEFCPPSAAIAMTNLGCRNPNPILINASSARLYAGKRCPPAIRNQSRRAHGH